MSYKLSSNLYKHLILGFDQNHLEDLDRLTQTEADEIVRHTLADLVEEHEENEFGHVYTLVTGDAIAFRSIGITSISKQEAYNIKTYLNNGQILAQTVAVAHHIVERDYGGFTKYIIVRSAMELVDVPQEVTV